MTLHQTRPGPCLLSTALAILCVLLSCARPAQAQNTWNQVRKAIEKSTLDQPGTKPFHLKATFAPTRETNKAARPAGEIEIWWQSPTMWRREIQYPGFHQVAIQNANRSWQKTDQEYFPQWLDELSTAILRPVPLAQDVLEKRVNSAEVRHLMGQTNVDWEPTAEFPDEQANGKGGIALMDDTGLLLYTDGPGFGGLYHDFKDFHGRKVAMTVASGYTEVTARLSLLEDLGPTPAGFFDTDAPGGDPQPIATVVLSENELRRNLIPGPAFSWPALKDGPLEGVVWTEVVLDRAGNVREMTPPIADNPGVRDAAAAGFKAMHFQPILRNGIAVQAMGRISVPFRTVRPAGVESFDSARAYFAKGRKATFLAAGSNAPYKLRAEFQIGAKAGIETGRYEDTWISTSQWKREAWFESSHLVKSQSGAKHYVLAEGAQAGTLKMVMQLIEPIPAEDTMTESDWRIRRDKVDGTNAILVLRGPEGPNGELEPGKSQAYWFDDAGDLLKCYTSGFDVRMLSAASYNGVSVPRRIDVAKDGRLGLRFTVIDIGSADPALAKSFVLKGHEWERAFTSEAR